MAQDNFGREVNMSSDDIFAGMTSPVSQTGADDILPAINELVKQQKAQAKQLGDVIKAAIGNNKALVQKVDALREAIEKSVQGGRVLNEQIKAANKNKGGKAESVSARDFTKFADKVMQPSKEVQAIKKILYSQNTVVVKEKGLRKLMGELIRLVEGSAKKPRSATSNAAAATMSSSGGSTPWHGTMNEDAGLTGQINSAGTNGTKKGFEAQELINKSVKSYLGDLRRGAQLEHESTIQRLLYKKAIDDTGRLKNADGKYDHQLLQNEELRWKYVHRWNKAEQLRSMQLRARVAQLYEEGATQKEINKALDEATHYADKLNKYYDREITSDYIKKIGQRFQSTGVWLGQLGTGTDVWSEATKGVLENERKWVQMSGDTAFAQGVITHQFEDQEKLTHSIWTISGGILSNSEAQIKTGKSRAEWQKQINALEKRGIKDRKQSLALSEKALSLSTATGASVDQTVDFFAKMNMQMGMTNNQVGQLSTAIQQAGQFSGVTGDALMSAVKSTEKVIMNMRNIGTLTADVAGEFMKLQVSAEKFGVGTEMAELQQAMTGGLESFHKAGRGTQQMLIEAAGRQNVSFMDLQTGEADPKAIMKGIGDIFTTELRAVNSTAKSVSDLNKQERQALQVRMSRFGMQIGQLEQLDKAQREANKSYTERLEDIQRKEDDRMTKEQKAQVKYQASALTLSEASTILQQKSLAAGDKDTLKAMGVSGEDKRSIDAQLINKIAAELQESKKQAVAAGGDITRMGPDITKQLIEEAQGGKTERFVAAQQEAQQAITNELQRINNPVTETNRLLQRINDNLQAGWGSMLANWTKWLAIGGLMGVGIGKLIFGLATTHKYLGGLWQAGVVQKNSIAVHDRHVERAIADSGGAGGGSGDYGDGSSSGRRRRRRRRRTPRTRGFGRSRGRFGGFGRRIAGSRFARGAGRFMRGAGGKIGGIGGMLGLDMLAGGGMPSVEALAEVASTSKLGTNLASKGAGLASKIPGGAKLLGGLGKVGSVGGKVLPFLAPLLGGIAGVAGAEEAGRGKVEGGILGALTGSADTGSMFSGALGLEKGGAADEALGIAGATAGGAMTGAAIGSVVPVVGTAIGAVVGGVLGGGAEIYKVLTKKDSPLRKKLGEWGTAIGDCLKNVTGKLWDGAKTVGGWIAAPYQFAYKQANEIGGKLWEGTQNFAGKMWDGAQKTGAAIYNYHQTIGKKAIEIGSVLWNGLTKIGSKLWEMSQAAAKGILTTIVPGASGLGLDKAVREDRAATNPDAADAAVTKDMSSVEKNTSDTVEKMDKLIALMQTLVLTVQQQKTDVASISPTSRTTPSVSPDFRNWQLGSQLGSATKGPVVPDGRV